VSLLDSLAGAEIDRESNEKSGGGESDGESGGESD
jgi:hypothetical protein